MRVVREWIAVAAALLVAVALQGCSTTSSHPTQEGTSSSVVFPKPDSAWPKEGTFPTLESLRLLAPGMTKDQLYALVGRPHFNEGMAAVREWDYLFNFRTGKPAPGDVVQCQMKVLFDKDMLARTYFWAPESCAGFLRPAAAPAPVPLAVVPPAPKTPQARTVTLGADALFAFGRSGTADMQAEGRRQVEGLAHELAQVPSLKRVDVTAYTDRIGSAASNRRLSQQRAETVRQLLVAQGVPAKVVTATGRGAADPVSRCGVQPRAELIRCLAPDRRVEIRSVDER